MVCKISGGRGGHVTVRIRGTLKKIVEESPMHYVARWKVSVAQMWIKEENWSFDEIASRPGCDSEAA